MQGAKPILILQFAETLAGHGFWSSGVSAGGNTSWLPIMCSNLRLRTCPLTPGTPLSSLPGVP